MSYLGVLSIDLSNIDSFRAKCMTFDLKLRTDEGASIRIETVAITLVFDPLERFYNAPNIKRIRTLIGPLTSKRHIILNSELIVVICSKGACY